MEGTANNKLKYLIRKKEDISNKILLHFKNLVNILVIKFGITDKIDLGDKNLIISHLANVYPLRDLLKIYNQNFYFTIAYHKLLYILYRKNKHVSFTDPRVLRILNRNRDLFYDSYRLNQLKKNFILFLQNKLLLLNSKFNKSYYLTIIRKLCLFLSNPLDAPYKRRDIIKLIRLNSYGNGKKIPKNYIYRVFYILKKNFKQWKK